MGLLDSVLGSAMGAMGGGQGGAGADMLMRVLGGLLGPGGVAGGAGGAGGLAGLVQQLQQGGLGDAVQSWVGHGQNQPVSAEQLHAALGGDQVSAMAQEAGVPQDDLMAQLSKLLPGVVDKLTPNGELPAGGTGNISDMLGGLIGGLLKR